MKEMAVGRLVDDTTEALQNWQLRPGVRYRYLLEFRIFRHHYGTATTVFPEMFHQYVQDAQRRYTTHDISLVKFRRVRWAVDRLEQCYREGTLTWRRLPPMSAAAPPAPVIPDHVGDFCAYLQAAGRSSSTLRGYGRIAADFQRHLDERGRTQWNQVSGADVREFIPYMAPRYQPSSMGPVLTGLRAFLAFLATCEGTADSLPAALPRGAAPRTVVALPPTDDETQRLLATIDRTTAIGKRDWAMLAFALYLGLRSIDIIRLDWANLDWRKSTVSLVQHKTGRPLVLPLLPVVGNALVDYVTSARPDSGSPRVFLCHRPPYQPFSNAWSFSGRIKGYMQEAGIRQNPGDRGGTHWLRHALATRLLEAATPMSIIASVLGHGRPDSTSDYLAIDVKHLRQCALSLTDAAGPKEA